MERSGVKNPENICQEDDAIALWVLASIGMITSFWISMTSPA
jgi:hypothetical protein